MEGGQGGEIGRGASENSVGASKMHWFRAPLKPNNWSDLAGDEGGGMGGGVGRWPMEQCGSNKRHWFPFSAPLNT